MPLLLVESPAKARTLKSFLGSGYTVMASFGHVRDLPKSKLGIDPEHDFEEQYVIPTKAKKVVTQLKKAAADSDGVILATDEDREGEAIAWHLIQALGLNEIKNQKSKIKNVERIVFHEITKTAIEEALAHPRGIDSNLVDAQRARRILDRIVGYKLSPLLWKKIARGLSAGRVQSVALRLIVDREKEREAFKTQEYWSISGQFTDGTKEPFKAELTALDGKSLGKFALPNEAAAKTVVDQINTASSWRVADLEEKDVARHPLPPFMTATMQQDAAHRLGFSAKMTMMTAQQLYEGINVPGRGHVGLITYMRTDSLNLAEKALSEAAAFITDRFGATYLQSRRYKTKEKSAQEAHEAIRPTHLGLEPDALKDVLDSRQYKLYKLIWSRAIASQMAPALLKATTLKITDASQKFDFEAHGQVVRFDGFLKVYALAVKDELLPKLAPNEALTLKAVTPDQHFTKPPARFSEAMLIKALKEHGIGRPSTYASIIDTIVYRRYVEKDDDKRFTPTDLGRAVSDLLTEHFPKIVDIAFTAHMEDDLDEIANGAKPWVPVVRAFFDPFMALIKEKETTIDRKEFQKPTGKNCPLCGKPMVSKFGRFGEFFACSGFPDCKHTEAIVNSTGVKCPKCAAEGRIGEAQGELVARRTKRGKTFYGCKKYPACTFALWDKPTGEVCKDCGALMVQKGKRALCSNKECVNSTSRILTSAGNR